LRAGRRPTSVAHFKTPITACRDTVIVNATSLVEIDRQLLGNLGRRRDQESRR
jgi:hypothetical protein